MEKFSNFENFEKILNYQKNRESIAQKPKIASCYKKMRAIEYEVQTH